MEKRVVVTGMGVVSCIGNDVESFWKSLVEGCCGIDFITDFPTDGLPVNYGGLIKDLDLEANGIDKPFARKQDPFTIYAAAAATQAMRDSGLVSGENIDPFRLGTYVGSGTGGFRTIQKNVASIIEKPSGEWVSPLFIPTMICNMAAGQIAMKFNARGGCIDISTACATSSHAIGEAYRAIRHGYADAIISGGSEASTIPIGLAGFGNARALSREADPKKASRPFDLNRGGFVMADGAAVLILEEREHALARGAKIYAEMVGYGSTCDAYHATAPRPDASTQARCVSDALAEAGFDHSTDSVYVNAHGTGTKMNDSTETAALKTAFGDFAAKLHISSTKSMHGHMLGATGAAEAIASILAMREGIIPPTINLDTPDPECDLNYTPLKAARAEITLAISNSFGFGGHNATIAFRQ